MIIDGETIIILGAMGIGALALFYFSVRAKIKARYGV